MAPGASIIDYNIPDLSDSTILAGLTTIIEDNVADVVNMSFSGGEIFYSPAFNGGQSFTGILVVYDDLFAQGNVQGITFTSSSGDFGSQPGSGPCLPERRGPRLRRLRPDRRIAGLLAACRRKVGWHLIW